MEPREPSSRAGANANANADADADADADANANANANADAGADPDAHGHYRARDLFLVPGLLSLARIPLALCFPLALRLPLAAFAILVAAGTTDILDGWYARRFDQVTPTGSALDGVTDKIFVATVGLSLVLTGQLSILAIVLLSTREIGELPLVLWLALSPRARRARAAAPSANVAGKIATVLQFASVTSALFHAPHTLVWVVATAVVGAVAALVYWRRALRLARPRPVAQL